MKSIVGWTLAVASLVAASAIDARAQMTMGSFKGYLTGHIGAATGGDVDNPRLVAGASVAVQESTGWGAELDFGHASDVQSALQTLDLTTYMVNASWTKPAGLVRPFGSAGVGILQLNGCQSSCNTTTRTNDLALSAGGGAFALLNDIIGVRGDARYFWSSADHPELRRADNFGFWRVSIGVTFMWAIVP